MGINSMEFPIYALDDCVYLSHSYFTMEPSLKKHDGNIPETAEKLWVTNKLAHTTIKQYDMRSNRTLIGTQTDNIAKPS